MENRENRPTLQPARVLAGLLVNLIVLPGLGTIISGDTQRRKLGWVQMGIGVLLIPFIAFISHDEKVRSYLAMGMLALALWSGITSVLILWDTWKAERAALT